MPRSCEEVCEKGNCVLVVVVLQNVLTVQFSFYIPVFWGLMSFDSSILVLLLASMKRFHQIERLQFQN